MPRWLGEQVRQIRRSQPQELSPILASSFIRPSQISPYFSTISNGRAMMSVRRHAAWGGGLRRQSLEQGWASVVISLLF